jgi:hypothetical protein
MMVRLSTENSKQNHKTPDELMAAIEGRFGPVVFDLAADMTNFRHARYFAPAVFREIYEPAKMSPVDFVSSLADRGAYEEEVRAAMAQAIGSAEGKAMLGNKGNRAKKAKAGKYEISVPNHDSAAVAHDSFKQSWAAISKEHRGFLFLNPEFKHIDPWADRCRTEALLGADILFLVPAAVGSNWFLEHVYGRADRFYLNGRISFIPGEPYMKDCMIARFWECMAGREYVWDWKGDALYANEIPPTTSWMRMVNTNLKTVRG